jgi:hypothetical protein
MSTLFMEMSANQVHRVHGFSLVGVFMRRNSTGQIKPISEDYIHEKIASIKR